MPQSTLPKRQPQRRSQVPSSVLGSVTVGLEEFIQSQGAESQPVLSRAGLKPGLYQQPTKLNRSKKELS